MSIFSRVRSKNFPKTTNSRFTSSPRRHKKSSNRRWKALCRPTTLSARDSASNEATGEVQSIVRATAGWGKITALEEVRASLGISTDSVIYMGDGSSDLPVMMHVNQHDGLTIAVSEAQFITRVARRTVLSDNTMSALVPVLEEVLRWDSAQVRRFFATRGLTLREWDKTRTDMLTIEESNLQVPAQPAQPR